MPLYRVHVRGEFVGMTTDQHARFRTLSCAWRFRIVPAYGVDGGRVLPAVIDLEAPDPDEACAMAERMYRASAQAADADLSPGVDRRAFIQPGEPC